MSGGLIEIEGLSVSTICRYYVDEPWSATIWGRRGGSIGNIVSDASPLLQLQWLCFVVALKGAVVGIGGCV